MLSHFFMSERYLTKKLQLLRTCPFFFLSIAQKILVFNTVWILIKCPFQRYISCRHFNCDPAYEIGRHGYFPPFWKTGILGLVDNCTKLELIGPHKNVKQDFFLDFKIFAGLCYRACAITSFCKIYEIFKPLYLC